MAMAFFNSVTSGKKASFQKGLLLLLSSPCTFHTRKFKVSPRSVACTWSYGANMVLEFQPIQSDPIWLILSDPIWSNLIQYDPIWSNMIQSDHSFWTKWHILVLVGCKRGSRWGRGGAGSCASLKFHLFFPVSNAVQARVPYPMLEVRPNQQRPQRAMFTFQPQFSINLNPKFTF